MGELEDRLERLAEHRAAQIRGVLDAADGRARRPPTRRASRSAWSSPSRRVWWSHWCSEVCSCSPGTSTVPQWKCPPAQSHPGVTDNSVKLGYIWPGPASARRNTSSAKACQARIDAQNAKGGVNGRKIELETVDDKSSGANLTGAQGPGAEPPRVRGGQQLVVRVPLVPLPPERRGAVDRRWLRRHLLRRQGQREHHRRARERRPGHRSDLRQRHQRGEEARRHEDRGRWPTACRRRRPRRPGRAEVRRAGLGSQAGVPQHLGRLRQHRRRSRRAGASRTPGPTPCTCLLDGNTNLAIAQGLQQNNVPHEGRS